MLVCQTKNTFIRYYDGEGYIMNQMTRYDRVYNETGTDFLHEISRTPKDINIRRVSTKRIWQSLEIK